MSLYEVVACVAVALVIINVAVATMLVIRFKKERRRLVESSGDTHG